MIDLQRRLSVRFNELRDSRHGVVFFVEHGLEERELKQLLGAVRESVRSHPLDSGWWESHDLPLLVACTEVGYRYRGSGTDFWPLLEAEVELDLAPLERQRIKYLFTRASDRFRGARPPVTAWAEAFHLIAWPIAHALLPLEFHRPLAVTLANLRASASSSDESTLYGALRDATPYPSARFATLLEDVGMIVPLVRSLLGCERGELSPEIVHRLSADFKVDSVARRSLAVARSIQREGRLSAVNVSQLPPAPRTKGTFQLRLAQDTLHLEARFPQLGSESAGRLRKSLRRRRFAPKLWGVTARVPSDQLLSGLPFQLKVTGVPEADAPLFPDLDATEFDAQDLCVLTAFELHLAPPHLFGVSADGCLGRLVRGSSITAYRKYWALLQQGDGVFSGLHIGEVGPFKCVELDPGSSTGARTLKQLGYDVRLGVAVRFAGAPPIDVGNDVPTFVAGDRRLIVPQKLTGDEALVFDLDGKSAKARAQDVVEIVVAAGEHQLRISSETDSRAYSFRGVAASPLRNAPVYIELRSEERTLQALLGGRLSFVVDGLAPIDGLDLTVDLEAGERVFSATGPLGPVPQAVNAEHDVLKVLLSEDVRDYVSGASSATLRARVGHLAVAEWGIERTLRPCWWELRDGPKLLCENGALKFGVVRAEDPVRAPDEGASGTGTYLLAPVGIDPLELGRAAQFATLCLAPSRTQLGALSIVKPRLERRRRGSRAGVGLEDLAEAYLRWSLAETRSAIGDLHRRQITMYLAQWMSEICCGENWVLAESSLPSRDAWGILAQVCQQEGLGRDDYLTLPTEIDAQMRALAIGEIRRSIPALWARINHPSDLDGDDYEALDRAFSTAYETLAARFRKRGRNELAGELEQADPGESPDEWEKALLIVREKVELRALAAMLLPSDSAARLMGLDVGEMAVDDVADELVTWARSARKAFAGPLPSREVLKASYALWIEPALALTTDWRVALDTLLAERTVARATRFLALRASRAR